MAAPTRAPEADKDRGIRRSAPAKHKTVVVVGPGYPYRGGIAHHTTLLCQHLSKAAKTRQFNYRTLYPPILAPLFPGTTQFDHKSALRFTNTRALSTQNPLTWERTARQILAQKPDRAVFIWHHPVSAPAFAYLTRRLAGKTRIVALCHNVLPHETRALGRLALRAALGKADAFLVQSKRERAILGRVLQASRGKVRVVFHPVYEFFADAARPDPGALRQKLGIPKGDKVILFFGYVRPYKGLRYLVEAMPAVQKIAPATLVVAGEFYEPIAPYRRLAEKLSLQASVKLINEYIPNGKVADYFALADVLVCPYTHATQSGILQTALGFGMPVVATRVGGMPDAVQEPETGRLVPPRNPKALADAVLDVLSRPKSWYAPSIAAFKKRFGWDRLAKEVLAA